MSSLRREGVEMLWQQFTNQIENEWYKKYIGYGIDINNISVPTKFAWAVYGAMKLYFIEKRINVKVVNPYTLHHYFQLGGFPPMIKTGTLDMFSMYLGYVRFTDFMEKNTPVLLNPEPKEEDKIKALIQESNRLSFHLYESAPMPDIKDMGKLTNYFTAEGPAIKLIKGCIENVTRKNRKLRMSNSFFDIFSILCTTISDDSATVKTKEKWRLLWYNLKTGENEIIYDVFNNQMYYLKKLEGAWKIHHNEYSGKAEKIVD